MPPKKSGKKGKKGKKSAAKPVVPKPPEEDPLAGLAPDFFAVQFKDLETRLGNYQQRCDELEVKSTTYNSKFEQLTTDKKDIVEYLKKQLEIKGEELADMSEKRLRLQQSKDEDEENYKTQISQLKVEFQETKEQLTTENMVLNGKLATLEEFKVQKEELTKKFEAVEQEKIRQEQEQKDTVYELERRAVIEKDKLKKDMVSRVNDVASEFRKVSNKQMAETTKRTIRENVTLNSQLGRKSNKTMELIKDNDILREREKRNRQQIELLEYNEKEMAKKLHSNQKIIRKLTEKCKEMEATISDLAEREEEYAQIDSENGLLHEQNKATQEDLEELTNETNELEEESKEQSDEIRRLRNDTSKLRQVLTDAAKALRFGLGASSDDESLWGARERRDVMLQNLLSVMTSAATLGVAPGAGELGKQYQLQLTHTAKQPAQWAQQVKSPVHDPSHRSRIEKLGLVPRPRSQGKGSKTRALSPTTRLGTLKRVLTKSVATQTASGPKALFFADELLSQAMKQRSGSGSERVAIKNSVHRASSLQPSKVF